MGYTKPIVGRSQLITVTDTSQTLAQLLAATGGGIIDPEVNEIFLHPTALPAGGLPLAWYSLDVDHVPAVDNAIPYFGVLPIVITKEQLDDFQMIRHNNPDKLFFVCQFDHEQLRT